MFYQWKLTFYTWHTQKMLYLVNGIFLSGRNLPTIQILKVQMFQARGLLLQPTTGYLIPQPEWRWFEIFSLKLNRENTWLPASLMCKAFFQLTCFPETALWNQKQGSYAFVGAKNFLFTYNDNSHNNNIHVWVNTRISSRFSIHSREISLDFDSKSLFESDWMHV